jgi:hypothetical protein
MRVPPKTGALSPLMGETFSAVTDPKTSPAVGLDEVALAHALAAPRARTPDLSQASSVGASVLLSASSPATAGAASLRGVAIDPLGAAVIEETRTGSGNFSSVHRLPPTVALAAGIAFLGDGYKEIGKAGSCVFRSKDGSRQFRMDTHSLAGAHPPGAPHVHFETYAPGARFPTANNHVLLEVEP